MKHADVSVQLETLVKRIQFVQQSQYLGTVSGLGGEWMLPDKTATWDGDPADVRNVHSAFSRDAENTVCTEAVASAANGGTSLDLALSNLQIDYISVIERAFKQRHMGRIRSIAHAAGRKYSHGHDQGPLVNAILEPIRAFAATNRQTL